MNTETLTARFDGAQWRCPITDCKTILADFKTDANETPFLLLPKNFVFVKSSRVWLRPKKTQKMGQAVQPRSIAMMLKSDSDDVRLLKALMKSHKGDIPRKVLDADRINDEPLMVQCPNDGCARVCHIPALRGRGGGDES